MELNKQDLRQMAKDMLAGKVVEFNEVSGDEAIRNLLLDAVGGEWTFRNFLANQNAVFSITETLFDANLSAHITNEFDSLCEVKNLEHGEQAKFTIEDNKLFRVAKISAGNGDLRRQRITKNSVLVETDWFGVKIYTDLEEFVAKRVDFVKWAERVALSFTNAIGTGVYNAIIETYDTLGATRAVEGVYSEDALLDLVQEVETDSGERACILGSRKALRQASKEVLMSNGLRDELNKVGYIGEIAGVPTSVLPQARKTGSKEYVVDDNVLIVVPESQKVAMLAIEGEALMIETAGAGTRTDMQMEHQLQKKYGLVVPKSAVYGLYKIKKK